MTQGWLEQAEPELAAVLNAPGSRAEKRDRLEAYLKARPKVEQGDTDSEALMNEAAGLRIVRGGNDGAP